MADLLWRTALKGERVIEVRLLEPGALDSVEGVAVFDVGPVAVTRELGGESKVLGDAPTLGQALQRWEELREVGDKVKCTWVGDLDTLSEYLATELRLAPPEGWESTPNSFFSVPVNDGWIDDLDLQDMPWEQIAWYGSEYGGNNLDYWCGWCRDCKTDMDDEYFWAGTEPDFEYEAWNYVLNPPMWPGGDCFSVNLPFVTDSHQPEAVARLVSSEIVKRYSSIELNDALVWEGEPTAG